MTEPLRGISSMATRQLLGALCDACRRDDIGLAGFESVGGVDAAARVDAGEAFDLVVLASEALGPLAAAGRLIAQTVLPIATSHVAIAVHANAVRPDVASEAALRRALLGARGIGYSTGPSGSALIRLLTRWGLLETLRDRLVQARAGSPVAALVASGQVEIGFQQFSELKDEPGIAVLGPMPPGLEIVTTFVGAVGAASAHVTAAERVLAFMASPATDDLRRQHGMTRPTPARSPLPTP